MIDPKLLRENPDHVRTASSHKGATLQIEEIIKLDEERRQIVPKIDELRAEKNKASKEIPKASDKEREKILAKMKEVDKESTKLEDRLKEIEPQLSELLLQIPNPAAPDVPVGKDESENKIIRTVGEAGKTITEDHLSIGERLGIIDVESAAKVSGSRFTYLTGDAVMLQFALIQYVLSVVMSPEKMKELTTKVQTRPAELDPDVSVEGIELSANPFTPIIPPTLITVDSMNAMGYLQHGGDQETYHLPKDNMYLVGTSEQSVGPYFTGKILDYKELPIRFVAYSSCFRREAGAYGKDTRGILRVHQFDKVEMFSFVTPESSDAEHLLLLAIEEELTKGLGLPYQVSKMCTGDLGLPAARKYDIETWIPSQSKYRETHSTSTCTDFQARRLKTRYKDAEGKVHTLHTLNGTAFAMGRIIIAIFENYLQDDGSIVVPETLRPFMGGREKIG